MSIEHRRNLISLLTRTITDLENGVYCERDCEGIKESVEYLLNPDEPEEIDEIVSCLFLGWWVQKNVGKFPDNTTE